MVSPLRAVSAVVMTYSMVMVGFGSGMDANKILLSNALPAIYQRLTRSDKR